MHLCRLMVRQCVVCEKRIHRWRIQRTVRERNAGRNVFARTRCYAISGVRVAPRRRRRVVPRYLGVHVRRDERTMSRGRTRATTITGEKLIRVRRTYVYAKEPGMTGTEKKRENGKTNDTDSFYRRENSHTRGWVDCACTRRRSGQH
jgi:hypothetical protein|uniref:Uncharacterized protein n=1 Tax=Sipha flava TaxID=143950 RepID=A0A2S2PWL9_9HEMI